MSTLNAPKTISKRHELRQDRVVTLYARVWEYFDQNRPLVYGLLAGVVVVLLGLAGYAYLQVQRGAEAQEMLGGIVSVYEEGDYRAALDGTETSPGLLAIVEGYGSTEAGNLARFYAADALFRLGEHDRALDLFEAFDKGDNFVGASALAGEAAIYESRGDYERAGDLYRRAALHFENELTSPRYLLNAGRAYEEAGEYARARDAYEMIRERFSESDQAGGVDFYLARVKAKAAQQN